MTTAPPTATARPKATATATIHRSDARLPYGVRCAGRPAARPGVRALRLHARGDREADDPVRPRHPRGHVERAGGLRRSGLRRPAGFIGLGAYGVFLFVDRGVNPFLAVVLAALLAGAVAVPTSLLAFRLTGGPVRHRHVGRSRRSSRLLVVNSPSPGRRHRHARSPI